MRKKWTQEELQYIKDNYSDLSNKELSTRINRTDRAIALKARELGLKKTLEHKTKIWKEMALKNGINSGNFKKGMTPWNKGKKGFMSANKTSFVKGHLPKNARPMHSINDTKDGLYIKVGRRKWIALSRFIYTAMGNELKSSEIITFADGNRYNLHPDNLIKKCRGNHLRSNAGKENIPHDLSTSIRTYYKIKKIIEKHGKD